MNYSLAAAMATLAFPWWMACTDRGLWRRRSIGFALIAPAVWVAHAIGWVVLGVLMYPFLVGVAWRYVRVAERVEQNFADHVQD